ncbi:hypothetical protein ACFL0Q_08100 [Thermodesulfobacteriota bacterium]
MESKVRLTNSLLAERTGIPLSKVRRWVREFFPPDPKAGRRSGYARELSLNEGFKFYLGGWLVVQGDTLAAARFILELVYPWMEKVGLLPQIPPQADRTGIDGRLNPGSHEVVISTDPGGMTEVTIGGDRVVDLPERKGTDKFGIPYRTYVAEHILYFPIPPMKSDLLRPTGEHWSNRRIPVFEILRDYMIKVQGREAFDKWLEEYEALARSDEQMTESR